MGSCGFPLLVALVLGKECRDSIDNQIVIGFAFIRAIKTDEHVFGRFFFQNVQCGWLADPQKIKVRQACRLEISRAVWHHRREGTRFYVQIDI